MTQSVKSLFMSRAESDFDASVMSIDAFISGNNFNQLERLVEVEPNKLQKWINANKLIINFDLQKQAIVFLSQKTKRYH